jgi:hypothetical protein
VRYRRSAQSLLWLVLTVSIRALIAAPNGCAVQAADLPTLAGQGMRIDGNRLVVQAPRFTAVFENGALTSVIARQGGVEFCRRDPEAFPLELVYVNGSSMQADRHHKVTNKLLSDRAARIIMSGDDSDREMLLDIDPISGDLRIAPSGCGNRKGLRAIRWNVPFARGAALVLPIYNGTLIESSRAYPRSGRYVWPMEWQAQLAIAQRGNTALMIHAEDNAAKHKALQVTRKDGLTTLGFESEQLGSLWTNQAAGGIEWHLNVYEGDWQAPADRYRAWMERVYDLPAKRAARPKWVDEIDFSVQWVEAVPEVLDQLARLHPPERTWLHLSGPNPPDDWKVGDRVDESTNWRTRPYDTFYPDYTPTPQGKAFLAKANAAGFKVAPHFNYFAVDMRHPAFAALRDWQIRDDLSNAPLGWYWPHENYEWTRLAYIHPGLGLWRRTLVDAVVATCRALKAPGAHLDQSFVLLNPDNGLVENRNMIEGLLRLEEEIERIQPGLVLQGEGLNEITFQWQSFGQAHTFPNASERVASAHPICSFLWAGHSRLVGFWNLDPADPEADVNIEIYKRMRIIPTLICKDRRMLTTENPVVRKTMEWVNGK